MQIRIDAHDLPGKSCGPSPESPGGYHAIHVGVQRRGAIDDLLGLVPAEADSATWLLDCEAISTPGGAIDFKGRHIQGSPGGRFIYLNWVTVDAVGVRVMFRRAKLMLDGVPFVVAESAAHRGLLIGRIGLTDRNGNPLCAAVRPPLIDWTAG